MSRFLLHALTHMFLAFVLYIVGLLRCLQAESLGVVPIALALVATVVVYKLCFAKFEWSIPRPLVEVLAISMFSIFLFSLFVDYSYDGTHYHQPAVLALKSGWNPTYEISGNIWANHYPNGIWTLRAVLFGLVSYVDTGRVVNIVFAISSVFTLMYLLHLELHGVLLSNRKYVAQLVAFSPIVVGQLLTNLLDGIVASLTLSLVCYLLLIRSSEVRAVALLGAIAVITLLINAKTSGMYFAALAIVIVFFIDWARHGFHLQWIRHNLAVMSVLVVAIVAAIVLVGFRPFVTNIMAHGTILYPPPSSILYGFLPKNLEDSGRIVKLTHAIFAASDQNAPGEESRLKIPGLVSYAEVANATGWALNGGFGPLFSLTFIVSLLVFLNAIRLDSASIQLEPLIITAVAVLSAVTFPEPWLARYIPLLGAVPFLLLLSIKDWSRQKVMIALVVFLGSANLAFFVAKATWSAYLLTHKINVDVERIVQEGPGKTVGIATSEKDVGFVIYFYQILKEKGLKVRFQDCSGEKPIKFAFEEPKLCWVG